jgi:hypothetical protein
MDRGGAGVMMRGAPLKGEEGGGGVVVVDGGGGGCCSSSGWWRFVCVVCLCASV